MRRYHEIQQIAPQTHGLSSACSGNRNRRKVKHTKHDTLVLGNCQLGVGCSLFTLTIVTVLALPINIVAGLLGMNVGGIPLADRPYGFAVVAIIVVSFTVLPVWFAFRKRD